MAVDKSPVALRIRSNGMHYRFFQFALAVRNTMLFNNSYDLSLIPDSFIDSVDPKEDNNLQSLFNLPLEDNQSTTSLSIVQVISLLESVDVIAKALLMSSEVSLKSIIVKEFPGISENWDGDFFKSAQIVFDSLKVNLGHLPQFNDLLNFITRHAQE